MTEHWKKSRSLIERAADVYDFSAALNARAPVVPEVFETPVDVAPIVEIAAPVYTPRPAGIRHPLDHAHLADQGYLTPDAPPTALSEEFRILKRQVLAQAFAKEATARDRLILINSAHPGDGKSWVAVNLALSLSAESDIEVLLIDADFGKPSLCAALGLPDGPGLMDALADPSADVEAMVLRTELPSLSVLPAGRHLNNDTEMLASERARQVVETLMQGNPRRIILFDSPPALAASAASELARHVGRVLLVVRADRTTDVALRDAVQLLAACPNIQAVLNGVKFSSSGRLFGAYYGKRG